MKIILALLFVASGITGYSQNVMTPEIMWTLGRVSSVGLSKDGKQAVYTVSTPSVIENKSTKESFVVGVNGGPAVQIFKTDSLVRDKNISPDGKYIIYNKEIKQIKLKKR